MSRPLALRHRIDPPKESHVPHPSRRSCRQRCCWRSPPPPAAAHEGDPHYRSVVNAIAPPTDGLSAQILDHDDALLVVNKSDRDVTVLDLDGKPYARLLADGTVQVNAHSSMAAGENAPPSSGGGGDSADAALYASVTLLAHGERASTAPTTRHDADRLAPPAAWVTIDRTGRYAVARPAHQLPHAAGPAAGDGPERRRRRSRTGACRCSSPARRARSTGR